jgi:hypothetical protein
VTWTGSAGSVRHGPMLVVAGTTAGSSVPIWVDRSGNMTTAPIDQGEISSTTLAVGVVATVVVPTVVWGLYGLLCAVLDAHRRRRWALDWMRVERTWRTLLN